MIKSILALLFLIHPTFSTALTTVKFEYYTVNGNTTKELHDALTVNSPIGSVGLTKFSTGKTDFEIVENDDGQFLFISATIDQNIVITLPKWNDRSAANDCVTKQWDNAMTALRRHEENHSEKYQQLESRLNTRASKLPPQETKQKLYDKVHQILNEIFNTIQKEQNSYDKRTNFGQKEGISLTSCQQ